MATSSPLLRFPFHEHYTAGISVCPIASHYQTRARNGVVANGRARFWANRLGRKEQ